MDGEVLDFGTSGALYLSAVVMYDRQTETLWTHFDGRAVIGTMVGTDLEVLPVATVSSRDDRAANPTGEVLSLDTGCDRPYGRNPYVGHDQAEAPLSGFFTLDIDAREAAMQRVVGVVGRHDVLADAPGDVRFVRDGEVFVDDDTGSRWHLPSGDHAAVVSVGSGPPRMDVRLFHARPPSFGG